MKRTKRLIGRLGELLAAEYMRQKKMKVLAQNYRGSNGEIDIVAKGKNSLRIIEVKTSIGDEYGSPLEKVDDEKKKKIYKTAVEYLKDNPSQRAMIYQFDVIGVVMKEGEEAQINYIENAFYKGEWK